MNTDHYLSQQRELDRKAAELESRERELRARDDQLRQQQQQQQSGGDPSKNWPPLPRWIPIKPCFYLDIDVEIPHAFQHVVKQMYYIWLAFIVLLILNFIGGLSLLFWGKRGCWELERVKRVCSKWIRGWSGCDLVTKSQRVKWVCSNLVKRK